jgi:hypothetical protein
MKPAIALLALGAATMFASAAFAQTHTQSGLIDDPNVNVRQSQNYTSMVEHNSAFRAQRIRQECDPIQSDDLRRQCIESFGVSATSSSGSGGQYGRTTPSGVGRSTR